MTHDTSARRPRSFPHRVLPLLAAPAMLAAAAAAAPSVSAADWPQWRGPRRDGVWREDGIVEKLPEALEIRWRVPIGGGYAGPAVAGGRVFVTDRILEADARNPENPFDRSPVAGKERVLALDAATGDVVWRHEYPVRYEISYPSGPRATPAVSGGKVYVLGAMGDFFAFDASDGSILWSKNFPRDFGAEINIWGTSASPLADGDTIIVLAGGRPNGCVIALDATSGAERWRALDEADPGYCPPVIVETGGTRQLIIWTPSQLAGLDPESGKVYWSEPFKVQSGLSVAAPVFDPSARRLFVTAFYNGPLMLRLAEEDPAAKVLWRGKSQSERETDGLHAILCTPVLQGDHIYGVCSYGQLRCLEAATGKRIWETFEATGSDRWWNAFIVPHKDRFFLANEQGELILAKLSPDGYKELGRAKLIEPTLPVRRRMVVWSHPAFANGCVYARNDREIVCADLRAKR